MDGAFPVCLMLEGLMFEIELTLTCAHAVVAKVASNTSIMNFAYFKCLRYAF